MSEFMIGDALLVVEEIRDYFHNQDVISVNKTESGEMATIKSGTSLRVKVVTSDLWVFDILNGDYRDATLFIRKNSGDDEKLEIKGGNGK